jgi:hypothetical protein
LAFQAAAHINEDEALQTFAYKISDPLGAPKLINYHLETIIKH